MPTVESEIIVETPVDEVYALAKDIERFPEFMADVQSVEILEDDPPRRLSRWVGIVKEFNQTITWIEEDWWDDEQYRCSFHQTEGDYSQYQGEWKFDQHPQGTQVYLKIDFEYDVPLIGALIKGLLQRKMQQNCESMLAALKQQAETG